MPEMIISTNSITVKNLESYGTHYSCLALLDTNIIPVTKVQYAPSGSQKIGQTKYNTKTNPD